MTNPSMVSKINRTARQRLLALKRKLGSWGAVSKEISDGRRINRGILSAVARGQRTPVPQILSALGLPVVRRVSVMTCARCGTVHISRRCTAPRRQESYDEWKTRNSDAIAAIVAWAETPREQRQKWSRR